MTVSVTIHVSGQPDKTIGVTAEAMEAVRLTFNPSGLENVGDLKVLASAFISLCDEVSKQKPEAGRELAVAKTNMQTASMWSVLGATKGL